MGTYYHMDLAYRLGTLVHQGLVNLLNLVWSNQLHCLRLARFPRIPPGWVAF